MNVRIDAFSWGYDAPTLSGPRTEAVTTLRLGERPLRRGDVLTAADWAAYHRCRRCGGASASACNAWGCEEERR